MGSIRHSLASKGLREYTDDEAFFLFSFLLLVGTPELDDDVILVCLTWGLVIVQCSLNALGSIKICLCAFFILNSYSARFSICSMFISE